MREELGRESHLGKLFCFWWWHASLAGHMVCTSLQSSEQLTQPPGCFAEHLPV